jgi:hypothetical protein
VLGLTFVRRSKAVKKTKTIEELREELVVAVSWVDKTAEKIGFWLPNQPLDDFVKSVKEGGWRQTRCYRYDTPVWGGECTVELNVYVSDGLHAAVEISWSSTHRSVAMSVAAVSGYQKAIELAALAEATINR